MDALETVLRDAAAVWSIASNGTAVCRLFCHEDGVGYCVCAGSKWDGDTLSLTYPEKKEISYWNMSGSGFIYQDNSIELPSPQTRIEARRFEEDEKNQPRSSASGLVLFEALS